MSKSQLKLELGHFRMYEFYEEMTNGKIPVEIYAQRMKIIVNLLDISEEMFIYIVLLC